MISVGAAIGFLSGVRTRTTSACGSMTCREVFVTGCGTGCGVRTTSACGEKKATWSGTSSGAGDVAMATWQIGENRIT